MPLPSPSSVLLRTQSDERLVALARAGHERAFEAILERYRGGLLRVARRYLPDARAQDALQQAFLAAWSGLRRGDDVRDLRAWLHRIARRWRASWGSPPAPCAQLVHRARHRLRAAATAVVPMPVARWLASAGGTAAGRPGGAGAPALLAKGAAVLLATACPPRP